MTRRRPEIPRADPKPACVALDNPSIDLDPRVSSQLACPVMLLSRLIPSMVNCAAWNISTVNRAGIEVVQPKPSTESMR
jgi:hypothetical protein